jgi:hypothetical protein
MVDLQVLGSDADIAGHGQITPANHGVAVSSR